MINEISKNENLWKLFTREEEYDPLILDTYGRFPHYASGERNIFEPSVSKYLLDCGFKFDYPDGQPFAVCLTHDIDAIYQSAIQKVKTTLSSLKARDIVKARASVRHLISKRRPWCNFPEIMSLEKAYDARSSFYFLALSPDDQDYTYDISKLDREIGMIADAGWEVGLHGGHRAYYDIQSLKNEKKRIETILGRSVVGYRNHYLKFQVPETWEQLSNVGFHYDTTFGYADCVGFRNGMCHPFRPYNLKKRKEIDIVEIPLTIMDGTLFDNYMRLSIDNAWQITKKIIDCVEKSNGVLTILWHNTQMFGESLTFYKKILDYCYKKKAWLTTGNDICLWYSDNILGESSNK